MAYLGLPRKPNAQALEPRQLGGAIWRRPLYAETSLRGRVTAV
jgi:hypothetical protein